MRQTQKQKDLYMQLKEKNNELVQLAEEIHASKSTQWVGHWLCVSALRGLINDKEEVLNIIKALCFNMDSYYKTIGRYDLEMNELNKFNNK